jgi:carbamoyl-phosphate synthase small subunit
LRAYLALEDGLVFEGRSFGATGTRTGEVVFNTAMTGYPEILTDPSYAGQIVTMTYPLIGNYGITAEDYESRRSFVDGFVVKENSARASNWRSQLPLEEFLVREGIPGIEGVDTRMLTKHIRSQGAMRGVLSTEDLSEAALVDLARGGASMVGRDLVRSVTCEDFIEWNPDLTQEERRARLFDEALGRPTGTEERLLPPPLLRSPVPLHVVAIDCGIKYNILRRLCEYGMRVTVVPASTTADAILRLEPDGLFVSNGPGDPEPVTYVTETVRTLFHRLPIFGICLGHQIVGLAAGGITYKLKFGHRGANHPVKNVETGAVEITSQNHGFAVDASTVYDAGMSLTHVNLNDGTCEGLRHEVAPVFSVQYHPEASPGPHDADYLFRDFVRDMVERL